MRGSDDKQASMFSVVSPERRVPADHPLRRIKQLADEILRELSPTFDGMYSRVGRPSIPPERLLKAQVLMALYTVRSDRQFCEQLDYNLLFRWFLDMNADEPTFDASSFSRNRERLSRGGPGDRVRGGQTDRAYPQGRLGVIAVSGRMAGGGQTDPLSRAERRPTRPRAIISLGPWWRQPN